MTGGKQDENRSAGDQTVPIHAPGRRKEKRAIVTISYGQRPWLEASLSTVERYSRFCGADFHLETQPPASDEFSLDLPDSPGRPMKLAYACKSYIPWKYMTIHGYDRVLVVDDSCCVRATSPDLFKVTAPGLCGYTTTNPQHADQSFEDIQRFLEAKGGEPIEYAHLDYASTSVMLYDAAMASAIAPDKILYAADLLFSKYPHQTLSYFLLKSHNVEMQKLSKKFNSIPALSMDKRERIILSDVRPYIRDNVHLYHITGGFQYRSELIGQIAEVFSKEWDRLEGAGQR